jgi:hypothetical protein
MNRSPSVPVAAATCTLGCHRTPYGLFFKVVDDGPPIQDLRLGLGIVASFGLFCFAIVALHSSRSAATLATSQTIASLSLLRGLRFIVYFANCSFTVLIS